MNGTDIAVRVKRIFGDESGVLIEDADIVRWINDGQLDVVRKTHTLTKTYTVPSVVGVPTYTLPIDFLLSIELKFGGRMLSSLPLSDFNLRFPNREATTESGRPEYFTVRGPNFLLHPAPSEVADITAFYVARPTLLNILTETPEIPVAFHEALVQFALMRAKELDQDWTSAERYQGQYSENVVAARSDTQWTDASSYPVVRDWDGD